MGCSSSTAAMSEAHSDFTVVNISNKDNHVAGFLRVTLSELVFTERNSRKVYKWELATIHRFQVDDDAFLFKASAFDTWNEFECKCGGDILELVKTKLKCTASSQPDCSQHITEYCLEKQSKKSTSELKGTSLSEIEKDEATCTEENVKSDVANSSEQVMHGMGDHDLLASKVRDAFCSSEDGCEGDPEGSGNNREGLRVSSQKGLEISPDGKGHDQDEQFGSCGDGYKELNTIDEGSGTDEGSSFDGESQGEATALYDDVFFENPIMPKDHSYVNYPLPLSPCYYPELTMHKESVTTEKTDESGIGQSLSDADDSESYVIHGDQDLKIEYSAVDWQKSAVLEEMSKERMLENSRV